jgi:hypothetical protein
MVQETIFRLKIVGITIADALIKASFMTKRWSVTKQVGSVDVQEAYTRLRSVRCQRKAEAPSVS